MSFLVQIRVPVFLLLSVVFPLGEFTNCRSAFAAEVERVTVFTAGEGGYRSIRIPSLIVTSSGTLLAFAEGRQSGSDQAANQIILKRSSDGGKTWEPLQLIASHGQNSLNNPCAVVDRATGIVWLVFQDYPAGQHEFGKGLQPGVVGPNVVKNFIMASDNNGATWTAMRDITPFTKPAANVLTMASGPGIGLQIENGPHKGRLIIPFNQRADGMWDVRAAISDNHGRSWRLGAIAPGARSTDNHGKNVSTVNEVQMVELADGSIRLNSRRADGNPFRKTAVSHDGGESWSNVENVPQQPDPACMASVLRYSFPSPTEKSRILYSGPAGPKRTAGTVRVSYDEGRTWPVSKLLLDGNFAYSCLARLSDGQVGVLYETGEDSGYEKLEFARFPLSWIEASQ